MKLNEGALTRPRQKQRQVTCRLVSGTLFRLKVCIFCITITIDLCNDGLFTRNVSVITHCYCYRPQTKFEKVMFSHASAILSTGGRSAFWGGRIPGVGICILVGGLHQILRDMVNERAVRILLECILVNCLALCQWVRHSFCPLFTLSPLGQC